MYIYVCMYGCMSAEISFFSHTVADDDDEECEPDMAESGELFLESLLEKENDAA